MPVLDMFQRLFNRLRKGLGDGFAEERRDALRRRQQKKASLPEKSKLISDPICHLHLAGFDRPYLLQSNKSVPLVGLEPSEVENPDFRLTLDRMLDRLRTGQVSDEEVRRAINLIPAHRAALLYLFYNGPLPTTAAQAVVTTGTAIKTMLQVKSVAALTFRIVEWGISFDGAAAATPGKCELLETGTVFGTVTAAVAGDLPCLNNSAGPTSTTYFSVGTAATGYTGSAEGSITTSRMYDAQLLPPTGPYIKQFPLGREPDCAAASAERVRVTFAAAINAYAYVVLEV